MVTMVFDKVWHWDMDGKLGSLDFSLDMIDVS